MQKWWLLALGVVVAAGAAYGAYQYAKYNPPDFLIKLMTAQEPPPPLPAGPEAPLEVPEGFSATIYARDLPGARVLSRDPRGVLVVSQTEKGKVVALPDQNGDGAADGQITVLSGLERPHGLAFLCPDGIGACTLFVAETGALRSFLYDPDTMRASGGKRVASLPTDGGGHFTRTLLLHPDGKRLLISVGSSCNACEEEDPARASVQSFDLATGEMTTYASGLRNTVFMATDPVTGEVWGTDNGRDLIGDDIPPDEINILGEGADYGWPICYGQGIHDTDFDKRQYIRDPCADKVASHINLQAHSAALGLAFVPEEGWPDEWGNDLLVALHGSWNRSSPVGYKVVRIDLDNARRMVGAPEDFVTGFLPEGENDTDNAIGRPVAVLAEPGGTAYLSDDRAGAIYKISLNEPPR